MLAAKVCIIEVMPLELSFSFHKTLLESVRISVGKYLEKTILGFHWYYMTNS